jgi:hypothetical protein
VGRMLGPSDKSLPKALAAVDLAAPFSPRSSTPPMPGSTAQKSRARFISL